MTDPSQVRINELARELEVKAKVIIDYLPEVGVAEKKTHYGSIDVAAAKRVRLHFRELAEAEYAAEEKASKEAYTRVGRNKLSVRQAVAPEPPFPAKAPLAAPPGDIGHLIGPYPHRPQVIDPGVSKGSARTTSKHWVVALSDLHHRLLDVLDQIEPPVQKETPGPRISRLGYEGKIPSRIVGLMQVVVKFRNTAEHSRGFIPTKNEAMAVRAVSLAISDWAKGKVYVSEIEQWEPPT